MSAVTTAHRRGGMIGALAVVLLLVCSSCVQTVQQVDLHRYLGLWYQPEGYPQPFTAGLVGITAQYGLNPDGTVSVVNRGFRGTCQGSVSEIHGTATVTDTVSNAKLTVVFPSVPITQYVKGQYWIIGLDKNYRWAVVSDPLRLSFFVLSRTRVLSRSAVAAVDKIVKQQGFNPDRVTSIPTCPSTSGG